jgi:hypothetical protein
MAGKPGQITGLADALEALRAELTEAVSQGDGEPMRFTIEPIELTFQAVLTTTADGKVGWGVLGIGADRTSATTQTLKVRLQPIWRSDDGTYTADFAIADQSQRGQHIGPVKGRS